MSAHAREYSNWALVLINGLMCQPHYFNLIKQLKMNDIFDKINIVDDFETPISFYHDEQEYKDYEADNDIKNVVDEKTVSIENYRQINVKDTIIREFTNEEVKEGKPFSYFGWEGGGYFAFYTISYGYWESAKIIYKKMVEKSNSNDLVDTLIYPLIFNYRHSIETFLKQLYFKYGEQTKIAKKEFLHKGHKLDSLWNKLHPTLKQDLKRMKSSVDINAIAHYIECINSFDPDSMMMRYPINKKLKLNKDKAFRFDFVNFSERMNDLCSSLRQLDYDLSNKN